MKDLISSLKRSKVARNIGVTVIVILIVILAIIGVGVVSAFFTVIIIGIVIYLGALTEFAGSVVIVFLLKMLLDDIKELVGIWTADPRIDQLYSYIEATGYIKLIFIFFLFIFTLSFVTSSVKIFRVSVSNKAETKKKDKKKIENNKGK